MVWSLPLGDRGPEAAGERGSSRGAGGELIARSFRSQDCLDRKRNAPLSPSLPQALQASGMEPVSGRSGEPGVPEGEAPAEGTLERAAAMLARWRDPGGTVRVVAIDG